MQADTGGSSNLEVRNPQITELSSITPASPPTVLASNEDNLEVQQAAMKTTLQTLNMNMTDCHPKSKFVHFFINAFVLKVYIVRQHHRPVLSNFQIPTHHWPSLCYPLFCWWFEHILWVRNDCSPYYLWPVLYLVKPKNKRKREHQGDDSSENPPKQRQLSARIAGRNIQSRK